MHWDNLTDLTQVEALWPEAVDIDEVILDRLFTASNDLCRAYAPLLPDGSVIPESWLLAEIFQARDIWSKVESGNRDEYGADGFRVSVTHLDYMARNLLRPKTSPLRRLR